MPRDKPDKDLFNYPLDEYSPTEQLDAVLMCLMPKEPTYQSAKEIADQLLAKQQLIATTSDVKEVLNKLIKDGFVEVVNSHHHQPSDESAFLAINREPLYFATFEGRAFIDYENGYEGRQDEQFASQIRLQKIEDEQRKIQKRTFWITLFTVIIATLVFILNLIQLLLYWKERYPSFPSWD